MRLIICNKYYFETGGPEHYMFGLTEMLEQAGHEVIHFSVAAARNRTSPYASYFVSAPVSEGVYDSNLTQKKLGIGSKIRMAARAMYSVEARSKLQKLIRDTHPDIVYIINFSSYLSPSIIDAAHNEGVPVVIQLASFDLICASRLFLRDGKPCTECLHGKYHGVVHRCVGGSLGASAVKVASMAVHDFIGVYDRVDAFVAPSQFLRAKMIEGGFPGNRMHHIPLFVDLNHFQPRPSDEPVGDYILYFGRIAPEKGVGVLIEAYALLGSTAPPLVLMGWPEPAEEATLRKRCAQLNVTNVHFIGPKHGDELISVLRQARFVVQPSVCYDNTPHTVYEALACARPVIANNIGSLPEQVVHEWNGLLYETNSPQDLARQMRRLLDDQTLADRLGQNGLQFVRTEFSGEMHVRHTLALFDAILEQRGRSPTPNAADHHAQAESC